MSSKISKKKIILIFSIILIVLSSILVYREYSSRSYIDKILSTKDYSYLPNEAKDFVKKTYEDTGELVFTEKNKKENAPYLNPDYINYLTLSQEEQSKLSLIPEMYITDFIADNNQGDINLPSTYNISNINNKSYVTPYYNQGNLGLCWTFASIEQAESYLMVQNNQEYSSNTEKFSMRQMDYATSDRGIINYNNENKGLRGLTEGGNYYLSSTIMSYGLSLIDLNQMPYTDTTEKKELADVLNYGNSKYELNSSVNMPSLSSNADADAKKLYLDIIKSHIIVYGGAYVGTGSPDGPCGFKNVQYYNSDNTNDYVIEGSSSCVGNSGHAMQIIGWDDNYRYSYCNLSSSKIPVNSNGTCSSGTKVEGQGAWILRNSWGGSSNYKQVYLTYNSSGLGFDLNFTTNLTSTSNKNWDNLYHKNIWEDSTAGAIEDTISFTKKINTDEKIKKVKFITASYGGEYKVSIRSENSDYEDVKTIYTSYPGIYTVDLSDKNIVITDPSFVVTVESTDDTYLYVNSMSVFTSNTNSTANIKTENIDMNSVKNTQSGYEYIVYSDTKNIASNETVSYALSKNGVDYSNYIISYSNNRVAENNINATVLISKNLPSSNYDLSVIYNGTRFNTTIFVPTSISLSGEGTEDSPYLIHNEDELNQIRYDVDAYYKLENDITLSDNWIPIGTYTRPFRGGFDGGGHAINNLNVSSNTPAGLFGYVENKFHYEYYEIVGNSYGDLKDYNGNTYIKNLIINNPIVTSNSDAGVLIGKLSFEYYNAPGSARNYSGRDFVIDNISIRGGKVTTPTNAGMIVGNINVTANSSITPYMLLNNIYTSTTVEGGKSGGLIGYYNDPYLSGTGITLRIRINNLQESGKIIIPDGLEYSSENSYSPIIGGVYGNGNFEINNYMINTIFNDLLYNYHFLEDCEVFFLGSYVETENFAYNIGKGYYVSSFDNDRFTTSSTEIKNLSLYNSWTGFNTYWKQATIDSIKRTPELKNASINYTSLDDITLNKNSEVSLLDQIEGENDINYIEYSIVSNDDNAIEINYTYDGFVADDIIISGLEKGEAVIHVINEYDGFEKDIVVTVTSEKKEHPTITYYINDGSNTEPYTQTVNANQSFRLLENAYTRKAYTFKGWSTKANGQGGTSYIDEEQIDNGIDEDMDLYAQWEQIKYTIRYNKNGGNGSMSDWTDITFDQNSSYQLSKNTFTRDGYTFTGWNTKANGSGLPIADEGSITYDNLSSFEGTILTVYAQWAKETYTISFDANGGDGSIQEYQIESGSEITTPENTFTRVGYKFKRWNTKANGQGTPYNENESFTPTSNITLYAEWTPIKYKIRLNSNNGENQTVLQELTYDVPETIEKNEFTKENNRFVGWSTNSDGTGTTYSDEHEVINLTSIENEIVDLYAIWREKVNYEINNYTYDEDNATITNIPIDTTKEEFIQHIEVNQGYTVEVDTKSVNGQEVLYTGGKTKIKYNDIVVVEIDNVIYGEVNGDGKISYLDYVSVYNHIQKARFPESNKTLLEGPYLLAADISNDNKISYLDYVRIYNLIKERRG